MYIAGTGAYIPPQMSVAEAIQRGLYDHEAAESSQQLAAPIAASDQAPPHLAVAAARQALERAGQAPDTVGLLLYSFAFDTGLDVWNPAAYVQRELKIPGGPCLVSAVNSACNGSLVGVQLACSYLLADPPQPTALVTAADCWADPPFDRWRADSATIYGDTGSALVLSLEGGPVEIRSICTQSDPELEGYFRGDEPFRPRLHDDRYSVNLDRRADEFQRSMPTSELWGRVQAGPRTVVERATTEAGIDLEKIDHIVLPFLGRHVVDAVFLQPLALDVSRTTFEYGRRIGHTGAGDALLGVNHLVESGRLSGGGSALVLGIGAGFTWTAAVISGTTGRGQHVS